MTTKTIDGTSVWNGMADAMKEVNGGQTLLVKRQGKLEAELIDLDTYEDLLAASKPSNLETIKDARAQYAKGDVLSFDEVFGDI